MGDRAGGLSHISHHGGGGVLGHNGGRSDADAGINRAGDASSGNGSAGGIDGARKGGSGSQSDRRDSARGCQVG